MIANPQTADKRFAVITRMGLGSLEQAAEINRLLIQLEAERKRAEKAEQLVRQLEQQLTHPKKEVFTLSLTITRPEDRVKADTDLAKKINEGWERFDSAFIANGEFITHYITLTRAVSIPVEPELSEAVAAETPEPTPSAAAKTIAPSAIIVTDAQPAHDRIGRITDHDHAQPSTALSTKSVSRSEAAFLANLHSALKSKADEIKRTNPFYGYQPRSFREMMGATSQP
jgi:hypothetical protein